MFITQWIPEELNMPFDNFLCYFKERKKERSQDE